MKGIRRCISGNAFEGYSLLKISKLEVPGIKVFVQFLKNILICCWYLTLQRGATTTPNYLYLVV